ncbi:MAG: Glu-tRNA(Gln) amidotransferase subunit GatE [Acidobacteria bacterium]|nr:Glu-tRNA(Gln) amidotransferase subunit GatE [Acidobacteriota bacterium]
MKLKINGGKLLTDKEYEELGFRSGLEIHQQLATDEKLFCHCPVGYVHKEPDATILRHMRPTLSELGEYDGTALMEFKTKKEVIYQLYRDNTCTYEMDDTPPFPINQQAVDYAIEISLLFNCSIVDEIHIVRKQYLDGSIPAGFQRTAVIGLGGWIPYKGRKIGIRMVTLEEDACREVSDDGHYITWKTDRLSTPLVEIITHPHLLTPSEVEEVNWLLAEVLRASGKVRRGFGTARQDVNVSISGGTRVEIKGVPRIGYHAALTHNEALKQKKLIEIAEELKKKKITKREDFNFERHDISDFTDWEKIIPNYKHEAAVVKALKVSHISEIMNCELQPDWHFTNELSGIIRVVACLDRMPNMIASSSEIGNFIAVETWAELKKKYGVAGEDSLILVWGSEADTQTALSEIEDRVEKLLTGVPNETRQSLDNGVTDFERVLPGPDRMYPDTDSSPTKITPERVEKIKSNLPSNPAEIREYCDKNGINSKISTYILRKGFGGLFYSIVNDVNNVNPLLVAVFIKDKIPSLRRNDLNASRENYKWVVKLFKETSGAKLELKDLSALSEMYLRNKIDEFSEYQKHLSGVFEERDLQKDIHEIMNNNGKIKDFEIDKAHGYIFYKLKEKYGEDISTGKTSALIMELLKK